MITDEEKGICNAVNKLLPGVAQFFCWNHVINMEEVWFKQQGAMMAENPVYVSNI